MLFASDSFLGEDQGCHFQQNAALSCAFLIMSKFPSPQPFLTPDCGQALASWGLNLGSAFCARQCGRQPQVMSVRRSQGSLGKETKSRGPHTDP